ncbi:MAG: PP2C family protein-serine/threonine phosphatase [Lachnospiraceae bacterium]
MKFQVIAQTDVGTKKTVNQDSVLIKHVESSAGEILMAFICDGMGGLEKGELASATVIRAFNTWFDKELPRELPDLNFDRIEKKWSCLLKNLNKIIFDFGNKNGVRLGTTATGILMDAHQYIILHVGDTRVYQINSCLEILTEDQTVVAQEVKKGTMTLKQAETDARRNVLMQCIGAFHTVTPVLLRGTIQQGVYMLCSDGFRHEITETEIYSAFLSERLNDKQIMYENTRQLIELVKKRGERDNISVIVVKAE